MTKWPSATKVTWKTTVTAESNETTVFIGSNMFSVDRGPATAPDNPLRLRAAS